MFRFEVEIYLDNETELIEAKMKILNLQDKASTVKTKLSEAEMNNADAVKKIADYELKAQEAQFKIESLLLQLEKMKISQSKVIKHAEQQTDPIIEKQKEDLKQIGTHENYREVCI